MKACEFKFLPAGRSPSLCLDYGVDEQTCGDSFDVSERGMRFISRWNFVLGTTLSIKCVWRHPRFGSRQIPVEGIVVWSEPVFDAEGSSFETTILFLELPDALKASLREFSFALGSEDKPKAQ